VFNPFASFLRSPRFGVGWILVLIGLVNALFWTAYRWNFENHYNSVQIVCDYEDTQSMSGGFGLSQEKLLSDLKARGVNSILLYEQTLGTLRDNGRLVINSREASERLYPADNWAGVPASYRYLVTSDDAALLARIYPRIKDQSVLPPRMLSFPGGQGILISNSKQLVNDSQLGFDPAQLALAKRVGLLVVARVINPVNLTPPRVGQFLDDVKNSGARIIFTGEDQVLGFQSLLSPVAREMRRRGLLFALVEFNKTRGAGEMAMASEGKMVRVHTVLPEEALGAEPELMVDRYVRAAKERNMRVLFIRLMRHEKGEPVPIANGDATAPLQLDKSAYDQNMEFVQSVSDDIQRPPLPGGFGRTGLSIGQAQGFGDYPLAQLTPKLGSKGAWVARYLMRFLSGVGVVGLTLLLLNLFFDLRPSVKKNWLLAGLFLVAGLSLSNGKGAQLIALQGGTACTVVAMLWGGLPLIWDGLKRPGGARGPLALTLFGFKTLWTTTLLTLIGGIYTTALLNHWYYLSKADKFLFPKGTQGFPLLLIPFAFAGELFPHRVEAEGAAPGRARAMARLKALVSRPFTAQTAIWAVVIFVVGFVWMARFGNDSGMEISPLELKFRALLEQIFITRPRTKEIFIGHPAFLLSIVFLLRRQKKWAFVALLPAIIGQTDVLNTMCHLHTPIFFNLWRDIFGVFLGTGVGFFAVWIATRVLKPVPRPKIELNGNGHYEPYIPAESLSGQT